MRTAAKDHAAISFKPCARWRRTRTTGRQAAVISAVDAGSLGDPNASGTTLGRTLQTWRPTNVIDFGSARDRAVTGKGPLPLAGRRPIVEAGWRTLHGGVSRGIWDIDALAFAVSRRRHFRSLQKLWGCEWTATI